MKSTEYQATIDLLGDKLLTVKMSIQNTVS